MSFTQWKMYITSNVATVKDVFGVYELSDSSTDLSKIIYIGRGRVLTELKKYLNESCTKEALYFRYEQTSSDERAKERERALLREFKDKYGRLPKCNERIG